MDRDIEKIKVNLPVAYHRIVDKVVGHLEGKAERREISLDAAKSDHRRTATELKETKLQLKETQDKLKDTQDKLKTCNHKNAHLEERCRELVADLAYLLWLLESNQLAEGSRKYFQDLLLKSMSDSLKKQVTEGKCFAWLVELALLNESHIDSRKLGFPVRELKIVSNGFQFLSDRRNEHAHPTKRLFALNGDEQVHMHNKFMKEVIGNTHISPQLLKAFEDSREASRSKVVFHENRRKDYETRFQPLNHTTRLRNTALDFEYTFEKEGKPPPRILPSRKQKRGARDASLGDGGPQKKRHKF